MRHKNKYHIFSGESAKCWFCHNSCNGILYFKNGDEIFSCIPCTKLHGKIKRLIKKSQNSLIKSNQILQKLKGEKARDEISFGSSSNSQEVKNEKN